MSKNKISEDSPIPKFIYLKIRCRDGVESLTTLECELKVPLRATLGKRILGYGHTCDSQLNCHLVVIWGHWPQMVKISPYLDEFSWDL